MLPPGRCLGPYEIREPLGAGGMGEVYLAVDTRLGRTVAIKALSTRLAADSDFRQRFEREARAVSSLNHPHICTLFDVGRQEGIDFLVMEHVEGETLAERLRRGALPPQDALRYALEIAAALDAAHEQGVVHRDLKPANVKITTKGIKLLDFGLAKIHGNTLHEGGADSNATQVGTLLGTFAYMSPEQARGNHVDKRADIWAFGCVVYETLTGKPAFAGETSSDHLAAVLEREPNWTALPRVARGAVRDVLQRCLRKDPTKRLRDIADAAAEIERALDQQGRRSRLAVPAGVALVTVSLVASAVVWWQPATRRTAVDASQWVQLTNFPDSVSQPALSPDGRMLTFLRGVGTFQTEGQVYVKLLPDGNPEQLTQDQVRKMSPVFSPDGTHVAYTTISSEFAWDTWRVPVLGGDPAPWLPNASGLAWIDRQRVVFSEIQSGIHMAIVTAGLTRADARKVYTPAHERGMAHRSYPSPDGTTLLLTEMDGSGAWTPCRLVPLDGRTSGRQIGPPGGCTFGAWSPDGQWVYLSSNAGGAFHLWRQRVPDGEPEQLTFGPTEEEGIAVAPDGRSIVTAVGLGQRRILFHDDQGEREISLEGYAFNPKFTPDGTRLLYQVVNSGGALDGPSDLWMADVDSGRRERLFEGIPSAGVSNSVAGGSYDISRDGRRVVLTASDPAGKPRVWVMPMDRSSPPRQIPSVEGHHPLFGSAGEILFRADEDSLVLYRVREDGTELRRLIDQPGVVTGLSPDARHLVAWVYVAGAGTMIYPLDGGDPVRLWGRDARLRWSADGRSVFMSLSNSGNTMYGSGRTYVIPLLQGTFLPEVPAGGFRSEAEIAALPGVRSIEAADVAPGPAADVYALSRVTTQRNLYRIPVP